MFLFALSCYTVYVRIRTFLTLLSILTVLTVKFFPFSSSPSQFFSCSLLSLPICSLSFIFLPLSPLYSLPLLLLLSFFSSLPPTLSFLSIYSVFLIPLQCSVRLYFFFLLLSFSPLYSRPRHLLIFSFFLLRHTYPYMVPLS